MPEADPVGDVGAVLVGGEVRRRRVDEQPERREDRRQRPRRDPAQRGRCPRRRSAVARSPSRKAAISSIELGPLDPRPVPGVRHAAHGRRRRRAPRRSASAKSRRDVRVAARPRRRAPGTSGARGRAPAAASFARRARAVEAQDRALGAGVEVLEDLVDEPPRASAGGRRAPRAGAARQSCGSPTPMRSSPSTGVRQMRAVRCQRYPGRNVTASMTTRRSTRSGLRIAHSRPDRPPVVHEQPHALDAGVLEEPPDEALVALHREVAVAALAGAAEAGQVGRQAAGPLEERQPSRRCSSARRGRTAPGRRRVADGAVRQNSGWPSSSSVCSEMVAMDRPGLYPGPAPRPGAPLSGAAVLPPWPLTTGPCPCARTS